MKSVFFSYIILILVVAILGSCGEDSKTSMPKAKNGVLDLSNWDFEKQGNIALDGEWQFYWEKFVTPDSTTLQTLQPDTLCMVPAYWNDMIINKKRINGNGYATYRLKVILPEYKKETFALKLLSFTTAYQLYADGKSLCGKGEIGTSKEGMLPSYSTDLATFIPQKQEIEIVVHISNYYHRLGGIWQEIILGKEEEVLHQQILLLGVSLFLSGSILIMALYHFGLYLLRYKEKSTLYFAFFCLVIFIRIAVTGEMWLDVFYLFNWHIVIFLEYASFYIAVPLFATFVQSIFPNEFPTKVLRIMQVVALVFVAFLVFTNTNVYSHTPPYFQIYVLLTGLYIVYILVKALKNRREGAGSFILGFTVLFGTTINDILYQQAIINTMYLISFGLFIFIFSQAFLISLRFSKSFEQVETLSKQLEVNNLNLEERVKERTASLVKANKKITDSIVYASRIQNAMLPSEEDVQMLLPNNFVYFKPRDIVSGDFYYIRILREKLIFAAADCTGHGVPGAFMSMLNISLLNEIVNNDELDNAGEVLNLLRTRIKSALKQQQRDSLSDGMDITFCILNLENGSLQVASAHNSLLIVRNSEMIAYQADKMPVGIHYKEKPFTNQVIELQQNDMLYLYSDGYYSQFGGNADRTYSKKRFKQLLVKIAELPVNEQQQHLETEFQNWRGTKPQIDDIVVIGYKYV